MLTVTKEFVTPELAKKYVTVTEALGKKYLSEAGYRLNRTKQETVVARYARDLVNGGWKESHQGLLLGKDDRVLDGQHRLAAIIRTGIGHSFFVFRDPELLTAMELPVDIGYKRSAAVVNNVSPKLNALSALAVEIVSGIKNPTPADIKPYADAFEDAYLTLQSRTQATRRSISTAAIQLAVTTSLMLGRDQDYVLDTYASMITDRLADIPPYPASLYKQLVIQRVSLSSRQVFARAIRIFDPKRRKLTKIAVMDEALLLEDAKDHLRLALSNQTVLGTS